MAQKTLHVVFTPSGAGCLRPALQSAGRDDQVVAFFDNLSFGPINPPDSSRADWVADQLGRTGWDEVVAGSETFWREALSSDHRKVAWLSRRSAMEYAGFLEWLWRLGGGGCEVVDLTDVKISRRAPNGPPSPPTLVRSIAMLAHDAIRDNALWDLAKALPIDTRAGYVDLWQKLRAENAPLRVLEGNGLRSAPITFFDSFLMSHVKDNWRKVAMVVGEALASQWDDDAFQASDLFLAARINALVECGRLELQGRSAFEMRFSEVRLPRTRR